MHVIDTGERLRSIATRRSLLPPRGATDSPEAARSFDWLFRRYAPAMARYVRSMLSGSSGPIGPGEAEDIVQAYLAECLEKGWLSGAGEEVRCFRSYLQTQLRRFVLARIRDASAAKRWGGVAGGDGALSTVRSATGDPSEADLDRGFVDVAADLALDDLRQGNAEYFEIVSDLVRTDGVGSPDLAARMGRTEKQLVHLRHRARRRFAILLFDRLRETVRDPEDHEALCRRLEPYLP